MTWIFLAVLCAAFALYIAAPLFFQRAREYSPQLSAAQVRSESLQRQKRELHLDRETDKIDDAEFQRLKSELELEESVAATRASSRGETLVAVSNADDDLALEAEILIARARNRAPHASSETPQNDVDAALEAEIARARKRVPHATQSNASQGIDAALENEIAKARASTRAAPETPHDSTAGNAATNASPANAAWTCPSCARAMSAADHFCASCGTPRANVSAT